MGWLRRAYNAAAILAVVALLGVTALVLASALAGRGLPFTGGFTSSDERLSFDRIVTRPVDQSATAEEAPTSSPTASPTSPATAMPVAPSAPVVVSAESIGGATALVYPQAVETSTETKGATTVTWESSFADFDYTLGETVAMTVNWTVKAGAASYDSFALRGYTSSSNQDPAEGTALDVRYPGADGPTSVDVSFAFTGLHLDAARNVEIGKGHFKLYLTVDANGDGIPETLVGYGLNVRVEDPQT